MSSGKEGAYDLLKSSFEVKVGLAEMLRGGAIIEVTSPEEARLSEEAGAISVIAANPSSQDSILRMTDPILIQKIQEAVSIPVMAMCRVGHIVEAQILEALFVDFIHENDELTPADENHHIDKHDLRTPFVSSVNSLECALRRISEGAALVKTGDLKSLDLAKTIQYLRSIRKEIHMLSILDSAELMTEAKKMGAPLRLIKLIAETGRLPVPLFAAGGIKTSADAALVIRFGAESLFIGNQIFDQKTPLPELKAIVSAINHANNPEALANIALGKFIHDCTPKSVFGLG